MALRNVRRDVNEHIKKLQKNKELSEDEMHHYLEQVDKALEKHLAEVDLHIAPSKRRSPNSSHVPDAYGPGRGARR